MSTFASLLRTKATAIWLILVTAATVSWWLGTDHGLAAGHDHTLVGVVIMLVAFFKIRLVGLYFMDLKDAPAVLRGLFEGYCVAVGALVIGMYAAV